METKNLLREVSRSFYLTLQVLPRSINHQISLAYLLARAADTIADTALLEITRRLEALVQFKKSIQAACGGGAAELPNLGDVAEAQETTTGEGTAAERVLLENLAGLLEDLRRLQAEDRQRIGRLLDTIIHGQETDLVRFPGGQDSLGAFETEEDLDRYTYDVAGCVGEFWTEMCRVHVFPAARMDDDRLRADGILFGKGLQLVNILRDIPADLHRGRCYIPKQQLEKRGLSPADLLDKEAMPRFRPLYEMYLSRAEDYLAHGWRYTISLPYRCMRIRLACAWPVLIGVKTLQKLRSSNVLDPAHRVKITRSEVRRIICVTLLLYSCPAAWRRLSIVSS